MQKQTPQCTHCPLLESSATQKNFFFPNERRAERIDGAEPLEQVLLSGTDHCAQARNPTVVPQALPARRPGARLSRARAACASNALGSGALQLSPAPDPRCRRCP